jgi:hypothetical protein|tara:strand:+ start:9669 stop:10046 length:378 start_codon:yes stop_codon:yes gene_type:complete
MSNYNKPSLRKRIVAQVTRGTKGGKAGQWSARKAQLAKKKYEAAGGGYRGAKTKKQKSLSEWTKQKWTTASGKPSSKTGEVYAPKKTIDRLRGTSKLAKANRIKRKATRAGKQHAKHGLHKGKKR